MLRNMKVQLRTNVQETKEIKDKFQKCDPNIRAVDNCVYTDQTSEHGGRFLAAKKAAEDGDTNKLKNSEASLRTVMYLSCWGPNS